MNGQLNSNIVANFQSAYEGLCLELLSQGYRLMLSENLYDVDWEEDNLTLHYIEQMKKCPLRNEHQITIEPQSPIYQDKHIFDGVVAKSAPIIDVKFIQWFNKNELHFYAEAKNLSEKDWSKKNGNQVNASYYHNRYINTGIEHFLSGYYPSNGCLVGYVLNGHLPIILLSINGIIERKNLNPRIGFIEQKATPQYKELFLSLNQQETRQIELKHLFLQLHTQEHKRNTLIDLLIRDKRQQIIETNNEQSVQITEQINLLEFVKTEKFQGESGVLRINLAWKTTDDLDLHVETEEGIICHNNKNIGFGELDVDKNASAPFYENPQENVVFQAIPIGKCKIKVDFYAQRERMEVDFILSISSQNEDVKVYLKTIHYENQKTMDIAEFEFKDGVIIIQDL